MDHIHWMPYMELHKWKGVKEKNHLPEFAAFLVVLANPSLFFCPIGGPINKNKSLLNSLIFTGDFPNLFPRQIVLIAYIHHKSNGYYSYKPTETWDTFSPINPIYFLVKFSFSSFFKGKI